MAIIIFIVMLVVFAGLFLWMLNAMLRSTCPVCRADRSAGDDRPEATVIPVIPGFLWWCPDCNSTIRQNKLVARTRSSQDRDD